MQSLKPQCKGTKVAIECIVIVCTLNECAGFFVKALNQHAGLWSGHNKYMGSIGVALHGVK